MTTVPIPQTSGPAPAPPNFRRGNGLRMHANELGASFSITQKGASFKHPFRALLGPGGLIIMRGLVDIFEPTIGGEPISGAVGKPRPTLKLDPAVANANGESWACVEVKPNAQGVLDATSTVQIVHTNAPRSLDPALGRHPLVMILWRQKVPFRAFQIVHFNLRYERVLPTPGGGPVRHLFL